MNKVVTTSDNTRERPQESYVDKEKGRLRPTQDALAFFDSVLRVPIPEHGISHGKSPDDFYDDDISFDEYGKTLVGEFFREQYAIRLDTLDQEQFFSLAPQLLEAITSGTYDIEPFRIFYGVDVDFSSTSEHPAVYLLEAIMERARDLIDATVEEDTEHMEMRLFVDTYARTLDTYIELVRKKELAQQHAEQPINVQYSYKYTEKQEFALSSQDFLDDYFIPGDEMRYRNDREVVDLCVLLRKFTLDLGYGGSHETIDVLLRQIDAFLEVGFDDRLIDVLDEIDAEYAIQCLVEKIQALYATDTPDAWQETLLARHFERILAKLESGYQPVENGAITLFGATREVQGVSEGNTFARRVTRQGDIGLFTPVETTDIATSGWVLDKGVVRVPLIETEHATQSAVYTPHNLDLSTYITSPDAPLTNERLQELTTAYSQEVWNSVAETFYQKTGIYFENLTLREQLWILHATHHTAPDVVTSVYEICHTFGIDGVRACMAMEFDMTILNQLVLFAKEHRHSEVLHILRKYGVIMEELDDLERHLSEQMSQSDEQVDTYIEFEIARRAARTLARILRSDDSDEARSLQIQRLAKDVVLFCSLTSTYFKGNPEASLDMLQHIDMNIATADQLTEIERDQILEMAKENFDTGQTQATALLEAVEHLVSEKSNDTLYILKKTSTDEDVEDTIVSFVRFTPPTEDGHRFAGSFNVHPTYRGSGIGEAMLVHALAKEANEYILDATVFSPLEVGTDYVNKRGFVITGVDTNFRDSGESHYLIQWDIARNAQLQTKSRDAVSDEQIIASYMGVNPSSQQEGSILIYRFATIDQLDIDEAITTRSAEGYVVTRYFTDPKDSSSRYFVFERVPQAA